jgi:glycosyltransferase involved in cell wall biosynthesis
MRIGIFTDRYLPLSDGICTSIETFRQELEKLGHEVYVIAPKPSWRFKPPSNRIIFFNAVKGLFFEDYLTPFFFPPQAIKQIEKLSLDIIHWQTPGPIGLLGVYYGLKHNLPLVTTYHTDLYEYVKHYRSTLPGTMALSMLLPAITGGNMAEYRKALTSIKPERNIDRWHQKMLARSLTLVHDRCDLVITPSKKIEDQLISWRTAAPIVTLPTGVDKLTTNSQYVAELRNMYHFQPDDKLIVFAGRIGTEKNLGVLIRSFNTIGRQDPHAKLVLAGQGDDLEKYQAQAQNSRYSDRIIFTGWIEHDKVGSLYSIASVFAFPSLTDTQSLVVNEAAWAGLPIVMVDPDVNQVLVDGESGYVARNSSRDLAAKIVKILRDPELQQRMSKKAAHFASGISAGKQAAKLLRLYQETIERHRESPEQERQSVQL